MDEHVGPTSPDQTTPPPASYSRDQKPTWNLFGKFFALFSNRTTAVAGVLVLVLGVVAGTVAVQRSTESRQHAAALISPQGPCYPLGDVNGDGKVDAVDSQLVLKYVAGTITGTFNKQYADVDGDGKITSADALKIQRYIVGLDPTFPACKAPTPTPITVVPGNMRPPCYIPQLIIDKLRVSISTQNIQWNRLFGYGDVDLDGSVTSKDNDLVLKHDVGTYILNPLQIEAADVDGAPNVISEKSNVNTIDALKILRYTNSLEKTFPVCGATTPTPSKAPLPTPTPIDTDGDGFYDYIEKYLGTNPNSACGPTTITGPSTVWPADVYTKSGTFGAGVNKINLQDITDFTAPIRRLDTKTGDANFLQRYDLNADGAINNTDIGIINNLYPPMFKGLRAFNGPSSCQFTTLPVISPWSATPVPAQ